MHRNEHFSKDKEAERGGEGKFVTEEPNIRA